MPGSVIAWATAVLFAYLTNRILVFQSGVSSFKGILKEMLSFFMCRFATGAADWLCMFVFVHILHFNDIAVKAVANLIVIVLNYILSTLLIFRKK